MKFTETNYANTKEILKFPDHYVAVAVMVSDSGVVTNADSKKIVPKGTIVGGVAGSVLADETQMVTKKNTQGSTATAAEGVLMNDTDVTYGPAPGAMIIHGFIATSKLPEDPAAEAVTKLKMIQFVK